MIRRNAVLLGLCLLALPMMAQNRQPQVVDKVVAVVGKNIVLQSDIENQYIQYRMQGLTEGTGQEMRARILEDLLLQKLMLNQAEMDSITVTDDQVESELNRRIQRIVSRFGSQEKLEAQFGKSMAEIKDEVRQATKDNMLQEEVQRKIMENVVVTPQEVKDFFREIPNDSLPTIDPEYEIVQIVKRPPVSLDEKLQVKERLYQIRKRILEGESTFATMAVLYSEDPGSARQGGELGLTGKGVWAPEFENVAFNLRDGEISDVVETQFGFHIIQLIERKGDAVNCRHILLTAKMSLRDMQELEQGYPEYKNLAFVVSRLEVGELSDPLPMTTNDNTDAFRLIMVKRKTEAHQANLKDDYSLIQNWALGQKRQEAIGKWVKSKASKAYIHLDDTYKNSNFYYDWNLQ